MTRDATGAAIARAAKSHASHCDQGEYEGSCKYGDDDCPEVAEGRRRARPSSYHRMKQRAEIAEKLVHHWRTEGHLQAREIETWKNDWFAARDEIAALREAVSELDAMRLSKNAQIEMLRSGRPTWRHDLSTVVGGVLLSAGLIAAIVWGIYG